MSTMIVEVYEALKEAGASEGKDLGKIGAAARAIADYDMRFGKIEADLLVLKWMVGAILAGVASLIIKAFFS